jgi:hypothetical protein
MFANDYPSFTLQSVLKLQPFQCKRILVGGMLQLFVPVCRHQFHVKAGSIQAGSKLALKLLTVTFEEAHHPRGVSA